MQQPQESEVQLLHAQICQALADPTRILLLYQLAEGRKSVGELASALNVSQPTISRHLKVLRERGMVTAERFGASVMYSLSDRRVIEALDLMRAVLADNLAQKSALAETLRVGRAG
ncbi:MAG TPA: metalloregulator ArsR/SmtB family transcription factor [Anaerolineae bacterium]|nr:metalloregulator ArsR/SmtB family transcription factor [Anaerolineae bacterium]